MLFLVLSLTVHALEWGGTLPIPSPPRFEYPAPHQINFPQDAAGKAARRILSRVKTFRNFRSEVHGAVWDLNDQRRFNIQPQVECIQQLQRANIPFKEVKIQSGLVPSPIELTGPISGVYFNLKDQSKHPTISCELALRLVEVATLLNSFDVVRAGVGSSYRTAPFTSFHTMGLALDIYRFELRDGTELNVARDFEATPNEYTCDAKPVSPKGKLLLSIACALHQQFQSVLTPNYNPGHRDHFHVDIRPYDPRLFLR